VTSCCLSGKCDVVSLYFQGYLQSVMLLGRKQQQQ
jgi:hypothetical protein